MFTLTGVQPQEGSKRNLQNTLIEFTVMDDGNGINSSTLIVEINGKRAIEGSSFLPGYQGEYSDINPVGDNISVVVQKESNFSVGTNTNVKIQIQDFIFNNKSKLSFGKD